MVIIMGFPRVPYELRHIPRSIESGVQSSDTLAIYSRFLRRLVVEEVVPIGFEAATRILETYSSPRQREKYKDLIEDASEYAAYLRRNPRRKNSHYHRLQKRLVEFLEDMEKDSTQIFIK